MSGKGYIGKISAIVTVNTADATRAFNKSAADAQRYGAGLKRTIEQATRDAGKSFDNIFTPLQKLQRSLQASRGTNFNLGIDTKSIEQLALAAKQLATPLAAATKQFDGLSFAAQRQFSPALTAVQSELLRIRDTLQAGGTVGQDVFRRLAGNVEQVTGSISRLNETANLTKKLLTLQDAQGLAFARPEVFDSINRLVEAQRGLSSLPAATRGSPAVRQLITDAQEAQAQINRITARIERLSSQGLDIRVSQAGLDAAVRRLDEVRQRTEAIRAQSEAATRDFALSASASSPRGLGLFGADVGTESERAIARAREVSAAFQRLPESARAGLAGLAGIASRVADAVAAGAGNAQQLNQLLDRLASGVSAGEGAAGAQELGRRIGNGFLNVITPAEAAADTVQARQQELGRRIANGFLNVITPSEAVADTIEARQQELGRRIGNGFLTIVTPAEAAADTIEARQQELGRRIGNGFLTIVTPAEAAADTIEARQQELGRRIGNGFLTVITPAEATADTIEARQQELGRRIGNGFLTVITPAEAAADTIEARQQELGRRIGNGFLSVITPAEAAADTVEARQQELGRRIGNGFLTIVTPAEAAADTIEARQQELGRSIANGFLNVITTQEAAADTVEARQQELGRRIGDGFLNVITPAEAAADTIEARQQELGRRIANGFLNVLTQAEADADTVVGRAQASRQEIARNFLRSAGGVGAPGLLAGVDAQTLRGIGAQIELTQSRLASLGAEARGPVIAALDALRTRAAALFDAGTINTEDGRRQLRALREELIRTLAAADPSVSQRRLRFLFSRVGDVGRQGFANLSLGVQQAAFAIEDFFSVTGGLDQRIRAAGNNISQLGFVLGGTTGLITGISVAIGAQLVAAIIRWTGATEDAERRQRELRDALSSTNSALERQRQLAEQLRDVYRDLAKSIAEVGEPERFRNERQQREQIAAVQRQQEERRRAAIEANSPQIAQQRGRIAEIDRQLETEQNAATRRRLIERRNAADRAARREIDDIERRGAQNAGVAVQARGGLTGAIRDQNDRRAAVQQELGAAARRGNEGEVSRLSRELAVIENTIQRLADASARLGAERGQGLIGGLNRGLERTQGIEGVSQIEAASSIVRGEFERLQNELSDGTLSFDRFNVELQKAQAVGTILEQASEQARAFFDALQSAATELARAVEQEASGRAVSQRRGANAAEAEFGPNDPRAQVARRQQQQSEAEARRTEQERQRIVAEEQRIIRQFEGQARAGRGDPQAAALATRIQEIEASLANAPRTPVEAAAQDRVRPELEDNRRRLRQLAEATPDVQRLRQQADANDVRNQGFNQNQDAVRRGMEAAITPAQQAGESLQKTLNDLNAAFDAGAINLDQFKEAAGEAATATARGLAPAIAELFDAVQNAVAQGPSRAALNVSDVSTSEGSRELTRLLRGEDAARNVNIAQLEKQNQSLVKIIEVMTKVEQKMGIVIDLK